MITINGQKLPDEAIEFEYRRLLQFYSQHMTPEQLKSETANLRAKAVEQAIGAKLLIDESIRLDIPVPGSRVDARVNSLVEQAGGREVFDVRLRENGYTEDTLRRNIEQGCKVDLLIEKLCEGLNDPSETEMREHFEANRESYVQPERASAQHILIRPASEADADRVTAESRLEGIRDQIQGGTGFADLAAVHSECPSGKQNGGSLGWFGRGMMVPEFDEAVFSMNVGELSDIIETQFGFHLIFKTGADEGGEASYEESEPKIRELLRHDRRGRCIAAHVAELREKADIKGQPGLSPE
jgi:parvulin-like peptidyl-prolyl isomerase